MKRSIRKVAVLGSGVMGSAIACHFANIGCQVLLTGHRTQRTDGRRKSQRAYPRQQSCKKPDCANFI